MEKIYGSVGEYERKYDNPAPYTHEEIAKLLAVADVKYRALILLMVSSGIRVGAVPGLKRVHLEEMKGYDIYKIHVYKRAREEYYTFCTPEAYYAINEYFEHRKRLGEEITTESPLFRTDPNADPRIRNKPHVIYKIRHPTTLKDSAIKIRLIIYYKNLDCLQLRKPLEQIPIRLTRMGLGETKNRWFIRCVSFLVLSWE